MIPSRRVAGISYLAWIAAGESGHDRKTKCILISWPAPFEPLALLPYNYLNNPPPYHRVSNRLERLLLSSPRIVLSSLGCHRDDDGYRRRLNLRRFNCLLRMINGRLTIICIYEAISYNRFNMTSWREGGRKNGVMIRRTVLCVSTMLHGRQFTCTRCNPRESVNTSN